MQSAQPFPCPSPHEEQGQAKPRQPFPLDREPFKGDTAAQSRWTTLLLGLMMIMVSAFGSPSQEMLQDTFKSIVVSLMALGAGLVFFGLQGARREPMVWHGLMWLPLALMVYAIGSMAWSHTYLAGVEAVRWFVFSLILWLGMNLRIDYLESRVLWGCHWGVTLASIWAALQFWFNFSIFPQGPSPASTFVNRNFFAEYAICVLPYSFYLIARCRSSRQSVVLGASIGLNLVALMMTGTRSALVALLLLLLVLPLVAMRCWQQLELSRWLPLQRLAVATVVLGTLLSLGSIPTGSPELITEFGPLNAISRAVGRIASTTKPGEYTAGSFSIRSDMWAATGRMIAANPIVGVGAGAWEVQSPLYQNAGTQLETDFYAHNEILQLLAEYGLAGWVFITLLLAYLGYAAFKTWFDRSAPAQQQAALRATALLSMLMLLLVSNAGFPWRMAGTGALFALSMSLLAATDVAHGMAGRFFVRFQSCHSTCVRWALGLGTLCLLLACYISHRTIASERALVHGIKLAMTISQSANPHDPYWDSAKVDMLSLMRQGIELNRHYRKLTPMAADELASWGDWKNALWIWESVLESRPNVVVFITNIARAHLQAGNFQQAQAYLERARHLQPTASGVRSLNVLFLTRTGQDQLAAKEIRALFQNNHVDYDIVNTAYILGSQIQDSPLMIQALEIRIKHWPNEAVDGWLKLGHVYEQESESHDDKKALAAYRAALAATPDALKETTRSKIQPLYRDRL